MPTTRSDGLFCAGLLLLLVVAFGNSLNGVFLLDDFASIHQNPTIQDRWPPWPAFNPPNRGESVAGRPVPNLSFAVNYALGGLDGRGYHLVNLALHGLCAMLLFGIVRRLLDGSGSSGADLSRPIAFAASGIWMVHPLQSEVANYIVARTESLMALFYLLTIYGAIRAQAGTVRRSHWQWLSVAACAIGMMCKESMVTAPVAVVLIDRALFYPSLREAFRRRRWLYVGLMGTWLILAALMVSAPRGNSAGFGVRDDAAAEVSASAYWRHQAVIVPRYFRLLLWPADLVLDYGQATPVSLGEASVGIAVMTALVLAVAVGWLFKPVAALPFALCLLLLAPTSVVPIVTEVGAERRMYLPSAALLAAGIIYASQTRWRRPAAILASLLLIVLTFGTIRRNADYRSAYDMWSTVVDRRPHGRAYLNLAVEAEKMGRQSEVLPLLRQAVDGFPDAELPLGVRLYQARHYGEATTHLERFLTVRPGHYQTAAAKATLVRSWTDLGIERAERGAIDEAIDAFRRSLALEPDNADLHLNLANALLTAGRAEDAVRHAEMVLRRRPRDAAATAIVAEAGRMKVER